MNHRVTRLALPLLLAVVLAACGGQKEAAAPQTIDNLRTFQVQPAGTAGGRAWDGVVEAVRQASLSAQTSGRVAEVRVDVNDAVVAGQVLIRLTAVEQQAGVDAARAQLRAAEASANEAELNYRRHADLVKGQYVSRAQLDQARATRDAAVAARDAARARVADAGQQTDYTTIRAPYAGIVSSRDVEPGESVGSGQPLMTVFAPDALRIEVSVPQSDAEAIRGNPQAQVQFDDGRRADAESVTVFPAADSGSHAVKVRVQLSAMGPSPRPGVTAKVRFPATKGGAYPRVPATALQQRGEVSAVYVVDEGRVSLRQVRLGERRDGNVDVIAGLKPGEQVATDPVAAMQALVAAREGR